MDIKCKTILVVVTLCWSLSSCSLIQQNEGCTHFKSFLCTTDVEYDCYIPITDSCTMISTAESTKVEVFSVSKRMLSLVENLVYAHLRSIESVKVARRYKGNSILSLGGTKFGSRSKALPEDFAFDDILCSEYDVKVVPFKIVNDKERLFLEEVMTAFYHQGQFCFALYVSLNDCTVSLDFKRGTKSSLLLHYIATYPFLDRNECWVQRKRIMWETEYAASGLSDTF